MIERKELFHTDLEESIAMLAESHLGSWGVGLSPHPDGGTDIIVLLFNDGKTPVAVCPMTPEIARRIAVELTQVADVAEGKAPMPVNPNAAPVDKKAV